MILSGVARLGKDAEIRYTASGNPVANLPLAYNFGAKDEEGKRKTQWIEASLWGSQCERIAPYLVKGALLFAACRDVHIEIYEGRNGAGHKLVGTIIHLELLPNTKPSQRQVKDDSTNAFDDDIPF